MKRFVVLNKKIGETPLATVQEWKAQNPAYAAVPASYAGRLDPMASGKLLILLGDECKQQGVYTRLDKEYVIEVVLDLGSDTGDVLGIPEYAEREIHPKKEKLAAVLRRELGAHQRAYPVFSSKTVNGKPLFLHALEGTLSLIQVPEHIERIYHIRNDIPLTISSAELEIKIAELLDRAPRTDEPSKRLGEDFRIDTIRAHWESIFRNMPERNFTVLRLKVTCASGTYMRSLAGRIGEALNTKALALSITRTKIGTYIPIFKTGCWLKTY
ncbi:MAG: hypothetical protein WAW90_01020 [Minisyncoccia bacterium]